MTTEPADQPPEGTTIKTSHRRLKSNIIVLIVLTMFAVCLAVGSPCTITVQTQAAREAEAEAQLGSMKGQARVAFAKQRAAPNTLTGPIAFGGCGVEHGELEGKYYIVHRRVFATKAGRGVLVAQPKQVGDNWGAHVFDWRGGSGEFRWQEADSLEDFLAKIGVTP